MLMKKGDAVDAQIDLDSFEVFLCFTVEDICIEKLQISHVTRA